MSPGQITRNSPPLNVQQAIKDAYYRARESGKFDTAEPDERRMFYSVGFRDGCHWLMFAGSVMAPYIREFINLMIQLGYQEMESKRCPHCGLLP